MDLMLADAGRLRVPRRERRLARRPDRPLHRPDHLRRRRKQLHQGRVRRVLGLPGLGLSLRPRGAGAVVAPVPRISAGNGPGHPCCNEARKARTAAVWLGSSRYGRSRSRSSSGTCSLRSMRTYRSSRRVWTLDPVLAPEPHLPDPQTPVDLELVDPAAGPLDLDREIGAFRGLDPEDVALVGLDRPLVRLATDRPGPVGVELQAPFLGVGLEQASDRLLDPLVIDRRAHELELPLEVGHADTRPIAADLEHRLELGPRDVVQEDPLVLGTPRCIRERFGSNRHVDLRITRLPQRPDAPASPSEVGERARTRLGAKIER